MLVLLQQLNGVSPHHLFGFHKSVCFPSEILFMKNQGQRVSTLPDNRYFKMTATPYYQGGNKLVTRCKSHIQHKYTHVQIVTVSFNNGTKLAVATTKCFHLLWCMIMVMTNMIKNASRLLKRFIFNLTLIFPDLVFYF